MNFSGTLPPLIRPELLDDYDEDIDSNYELTRSKFILYEEDRQQYENNVLMQKTIQEEIEKNVKRLQKYRIKMHSKNGIVYDEIMYSFYQDYIDKIIVLITNLEQMYDESQRIIDENCEILHEYFWFFR
jgi:hypothetical protein